MAYCTVEDVQTYLTTIILNNDSQPTAPQVTKMCGDVSDGIIDPVISRFVILPVVDEVGLEYLKRWTVNCVLASLYRSIEAVPELAIIYDGKCQTMKDTFMNDPGIVSEPTSVNARGEAGASTRPETKWVKNESQW